jgi:hypothetical protein
LLATKSFTAAGSWSGGASIFRCRAILRATTQGSAEVGVSCEQRRRVVEVGRHQQGEGDPGLLGRQPSGCDPAPQGIATPASRPRATSGGVEKKRRGR